MKALIPITLLGMALLIEGCGKAPTSSAFSLSSPVPSVSQKITDLRSEVHNAAEREWSEAWLQDGDTWTARATNNSFLLQIKGRRVETEQAVLSEADRLNGVEWKGSVIFRCAAARKFGLQSHTGGLNAFSSAGEYGTGWNAWYTPDGPIANYTFKKQADNWQLVDKGFFDEMVKLTDSDIQVIRNSAR